MPTLSVCFRTLSNENLSRFFKLEGIIKFAFLKDNFASDVKNQLDVWNTINYVTYKIKLFLHHAAITIRLLKELFSIKIALKVIPLWNFFEIFW